MLVKEGYCVNQQIVTVVTQGQAGTGFVQRKARRTAENFQAHFYQAAGNIVALNLIGRLNQLVLVQVDVDSTVLVGDPVLVNTRMLHQH